jgi:hypothetical protein
MKAVLLLSIFAALVGTVEQAAAQNSTTTTIKNGVNAIGAINESNRPQFPSGGSVNGYTRDGKTTSTITGPGGSGSSGGPGPGVGVNSGTAR